MSDAAEIRRAVQDRYAEAARKVDNASCCGSTEADGCCGPAAGDDSGCCGGISLYDAGETGAVPRDAVTASLGCGNPTAVADLGAGDVVLDLGSGGGIDVLLAATRVGPNGRVYGLDMTDEMLELAERNRAAAGAENVEFLKGYIEDIPLGDDSVDVVVSNCVINLAADKRPVFEEMYRVLRPGGRIGVTDIVADDSLEPAQRAARGNFVGCIAGALSFSEYRAGLEGAGFSDVDITATHEVVDGMSSAIIKAGKPAR